MSKEILKEIDVDLIDRNPENPRIIFRQDELYQLTESIKKLGVQVPVVVYKDGDRYVLIDGERRWRCSIKLNLKKIPALVQDKPDRLSNLLMMFNIHALREQWDLLTISFKLPSIIDLLKEKNNNKNPTLKEISAETGLGVGVINRCKLLMVMPEEYKQIILKELAKPKTSQKFTEDFFIEMERALKTVERAMPELINQISKEKMREVLISKFKDGTITNRVDFRQIGKIARAEKVSADPAKAFQVLEKLFDNNKFSIEEAFETSVAHAYGEHNILIRIRSLKEQLNQFESDEIDEELAKELKDLIITISEALGD